MDDILKYRKKLTSKDHLLKLLKLKKIRKLKKFNHILFLILSDHIIFSQSHILVFSKMKNGIHLYRLTKMLVL